MVELVETTQSPNLIDSARKMIDSTLQPPGLIETSPNLIESAALLPDAQQDFVTGKVYTDP